jgi:asparaginyl-tRNA synthetase
MRISELPQHIGEQVTIPGWVFNMRSSGQIAFLQLRDGSGQVQAVIDKGSVTEAIWQDADKLTLESSAIVTGKVKKDDRSPSGVELELTGLEVIQVAQEYPIGKKEHGPDFLLEQRHLWLRSPRQAAILRIRAAIEFAMHEYLRSQGFVQFDAPILTANAAENTTELFEMDYFDEGKAYLSQSGQLYGEAGAMALGRIYTFGPTFRSEKSKTRRHLTEFWMIEPEAAFMSFEEDLALQEGFIKHIVTKILAEHSEDLKILERNTKVLEATAKQPFKKIKYVDAIKLLQKKGSDIKLGDDLGADDETMLTEGDDTPVFLTHFPAKIKAFYMQPDPEDDEYVLAADMLAPEGYGEIIGGSERIGDEKLLAQKIQDFGLKLEDYEWYLDLRRYGGVQHAGFGIGLERTVAWITGTPHIRETIPFPRMINRLTP